MLHDKFFIFTCPKDWHHSLKMNIRMSVQNITFLSPASLFFKSTANLLFLYMFLNYAKRELQKTFALELRTAQKITFCLFVSKPLQPENFSSSVLLSKITHEHSKKIRFLTSYGHKEWGENKKIKGSQGEKLAKRGNETTAVAQKNTRNYRHCKKSNFLPPYLRQVAKIYVVTYHSVVRLETVEISQQRTAFT